MVRGHHVVSLREQSIHEFYIESQTSQAKRDKAFANWAYWHSVQGRADHYDERPSSSHEKHRFDVCASQRFGPKGREPNEKHRPGPGDNKEHGVERDHQDSGDVVSSVERIQFGRCVGYFAHMSGLPV